MSRREQELIDQMRSWRAQIDARPEAPVEVRAPEPLPPREDRLAEARARRDERLARPQSSPEPTALDAPPPAALTRVVRHDTVITRQDAEFAQWKRRQRYGRRAGSRRASRQR